MYIFRITTNTLVIVLELSKLAAIEICPRLLQLFGLVHHEGSSVREGFVVRLTFEQQKLDALCLDFIRTEYRSI